MTRRLLIPIAIVLLIASPAFSCFQSWSGFVTLRSGELKGRITIDDEALKGAHLELHKSRLKPGDRPNPRVEFRQEIGEMPEVIARADTDSNGSFSFGKRPPGKYVIEMTKPSYETFTVELIPPDQYSQHSQLWIRVWADWCIDTVIQSDGSGDPGISE